MQINYLVHVPYEGLGAFETALVAAGHALRRVRLYAGDRLPEPAQVQGLIVMGGPMSIHDESEHPWLAAEKRFLEAVLARDVPVLGVCLGAQLIAHCLGARVYRNPHKEIGWFPVRRETRVQGAGLEMLPETFEAFHWHGETFDLPPGATLLASSSACAHQAFAHRRALALQFHLEVLPSGVEDLCEFSRGDLEPGPWVQSPARMLAEPARFQAAVGWAQRLVSEHFDTPPEI